MSFSHALYTEIVREEQAAARRRRDRHKVYKAVAKLLVYGALNALLRGYFLMVLVDQIHQHWIHQLPTLGYATSCWMAWLWSSMNNVTTTGPDKGKKS